VSGGPACIQNQTFRYTCRIILKHVTSWRCPSSHHGAKQRCAGAGVQESTSAGFSVFQQELEQDQEWIFFIGTGSGAGVIFLAQWF